MTSHLPNSFQYPNVYVDRAMAYLTEPELRVLMFTVRHIFGWQDRIDARTAKISLSMYEKGYVSKNGMAFGGCGLSRPSIVKALNSLVELGFLERFGSPTASGQNWRIPTSEPRWQILESRAGTGKRRLLALVNGVYQSDETRLTAFTSAGKRRLPKQTHIQTQKEIKEDQSAKADAAPAHSKKKNEAASKPAIPLLIKAWLDALPGGAPVRSPYANKTIRAAADTLAQRGITEEQIARYTRQLASQDFWHAKVVPFVYMADNIGAWLAVQPSYASAPAIVSDTTVSDTTVSDTTVSDTTVSDEDWAAFDALTAAVAYDKSYAKSLTYIQGSREQRGGDR